MKRVKYFSVQLDGKERSEFIDFQQRMASSHPSQLGELNSLIHEIGEEYGANQHFFRPEDAASALPPKYFEYESEEPGTYGLRLYCIRISDSVVVLLNGDLKTAQRARDCEKCRRHFDLANRITKQIDSGITSREIKGTFKDIVGMEEFELNL